MKQIKQFEDRLIELTGASREYANAAFYTMGKYAWEYPNLAAKSYAHRFINEAKDAPKENE